MTSILWYVHDHGRGHLDRARAVLSYLDAPVVVAAGPGISAAAAAALRAESFARSRPRSGHTDARVVALPRDTTSGCAEPRGPWHHAPASEPQRQRMATLTAAIRDHGCTTAVVDVSMEVAALTSLLGLRTIALRQSGCRSDLAHHVGLGGADVVWVPQHRALEPLDTAIDDRWRFTGAFSRYDGQPRPSSPCRRERTALVIVGSGGTAFDERRWRAAATTPPGWSVVLAGAVGRWRAGAITSVGHVEPLAPLLWAADVVITSAGWSSVADGVATGSRLVVVPEARPFDEQLVRARVLAAAGLVRALGGWPDPERLGPVLDDAMTLCPDAWSAFHDGKGASRAATVIDEVHAA